MNCTSPTPSRQRGAALAVALVLLVVLTLLGIAAVRSTQTQLRLASNAESRTNAVQAAESLLETVASNSNNTPVDYNPDFRSCYLPARGAAAALFSCGSADSKIPLGSGNSNADTLAYGYAEVRRVLPLFVSVNVMREAQTSARQYDFARYSITGGIDRSAEGRSAAEVVESVLILHSKPAGVTYE